MRAVHSDFAETARNVEGRETREANARTTQQTVSHGWKAVVFQEHLKVSFGRKAVITFIVKPCYKRKPQANTS